MPQFLIEIPHSGDVSDCKKALRGIEDRGSHFVTRAYWGCRDGKHCGWLIVDLDNRKEALQVVPHEFRQDAVIVEVEQFTREQIKSFIADLEH